MEIIITISQLIACLALVVSAVGMIFLVIWLVKDTYETREWGKLQSKEKYLRSYRYNKKKG